MRNVSSKLYHLHKHHTSFTNYFATFAPAYSPQSASSFITLFHLYTTFTTFTTFSITLMLLSSSSPQFASTSNISSSHQVSRQHGETLKRNEIFISSKSWWEWATFFTFCPSFFTFCPSSTGLQTLLCCCLYLSTLPAAWALASKWSYVIILWSYYDHIRSDQQPSYNHLCLTPASLARMPVGKT